MEARIYKTKRQRNGKRITGRLYRARVKLDGDDKVRDIALKLSDRQVAQQKLNQIVRELEHEAAGLMPAKMEREAARSPLLDLVAEDVNELTVLGRSEDHLRHVDKRLRKLVRECHWSKLADVTPASFQAWRKAQTGKAPKTLNEYLAVLSAFGRGCGGKAGCRPIRLNWWNGRTRAARRSANGGPCPMRTCPAAARRGKHQLAICCRCIRVAAE